MLRRFLIFICTFSALSIYAQGTDFVQVRSMIDRGLERVEDDCVIEAVLVSAADHPNTMENEQISFDFVNLSAGRRAGYFHSKDGGLGLMIHFDKVAALKKIPRFATVRLNLKGAGLGKVNGIGYAVYGLQESSILSVEKGSGENAFVEEKTLSELTDEDVFTLVRVKDLEFVFKDGALLNVYELAVQKSRINSGCGPQGRMDGWAGLLCDGEGTPFYYLMNTGVAWRRDGTGVPQGHGTIEGIIVPQTDMSRYGGKVLGRYQIRPLGKSAFCFEDTPVWRTVAEWNWNDNVQEIHTSEGDLKSVTYNKILSDKGEGLMYFNTGGEIVRFRDMNNPQLVNDKNDRNWRGYLQYGALSVRCPSSNWWNWGSDQGKGLYMAVTTENMKGTHLLLGFTFAAGQCSPFQVKGCPASWKVEFSLDGKNYARASSESIALRSLPWSPGEVNGTRYLTSKDAGVGFTEHLVKLPAFLLGRKLIYIRIVPEDKSALTLAYEGGFNGSLHPQDKSATAVNFGTVKLMYR